MKIDARCNQRGVALIIVMVAIFTLIVLAGGFAYTMKVEMRLARNHGSETDLEWLGRSGVEMARYLVVQQLSTPERYHALNQKWAGGTGVTNDIFQNIQLENNELGNGVFSIKIVDLERKFNINSADPAILQQAMNLMGVDPVDASTAIDSIMDWRDADNDPHVNGAESEYYEQLNPPYFAKNGPIDDMSELLLIKGVTPEIYWGPNNPNAGLAMNPADLKPARRGSRNADKPAIIQAGLVDLFTPISGRLVNLNTASAAVLQLVPMIDANMAQAIVNMRAGPDQVPGNDDDTPFTGVGELVNVPGMPRQLVQQAIRYFAVSSATFEVTVDARVGTYRRTYVSILRVNGRDAQILNFYWK
jgi:general secretion pathway protein K